MQEETRRPDLEAIRRSRRQRMIRRRIRSLAVLATAAILIAIFLFSPWGPWSRAFFAPDREEEGASNCGTAAVGGDAAAGAEGGALTAVQDPTDRAERISNTSSPAIAIVVDDSGSDTTNLERWLEIDAPLTFSVLPHGVASQNTAQRLYDAGFRIMMHVPTENDPPRTFSGNGQLSVGMSRETVFSTLDGDLATVPDATGINNHQGARGCNDLQTMTYMCEWAQQRGLFVVDSESSTDSQVSAAAAGLGFPRRCNQVFIDHDNGPESIRSQMRKLAAIARQEGTAIGICHFHRPNTPVVVGEMIQTLRTEGIHFAFVQDINN